MYINKEADYVKRAIQPRHRVQIDSHPAQQEDTSESPVKERKRECDDSKPTAYKMPQYPVRALVAITEGVTSGKSHRYYYAVEPEAGVCKLAQGDAAHIFFFPEIFEYQYDLNRKAFLSKVSLMSRSIAAEDKEAAAALMPP